MIEKHLIYQLQGIPQIYSLVLILEQWLAMHSNVAETQSLTRKGTTTLALKCLSLFVFVAGNA